MPEPTPPFDPTESRTARRWWPTVQMLDAGTELFLAEWKPVGTRPADIPREILEDFVFHFLGPLLAPHGPMDPITHVSEMIASAEADRLRLQRSPDAHRRHLAERLSDIARRLPLSELLVEMPPSAVVVSSSDFPGPPPLDPEGVCARCHAFGTVARVTVGSKPPRTSRFCAACWKEVRSDYTSDEPPDSPRTARERIAFMDRATKPPKPPVCVESRSWDDAIDFIRLIMTARDDPKQSAGATPAVLAEMAWELGTEADAMDGPMPPEVEAFIRQFAAPT